MSLFFDLCYFLALLLAWPFLVLKSRRTGKYRTDWAARFGRVPPPLPHPTTSASPTPGKRLLIHCVSVGELLSMRQLIDLLLAADPTLTIILTTTTDTGTARARELYRTTQYADRVEPYRYPLDFSFAVRSFLNTTRPDAIALVELETWPNFVRLAARRRIPICIINGRLTARSAKRYALIKPFVSAMFRRLAWLGVQTPAIADRFIRLGAPADRLTIIPTIKYDTADLSDTIPGSGPLAGALGLDPTTQRIFVGGSTGPGEEIALLETYLKLRDQYPDLRLAIAPRKPETVPQVITAIHAAGLKSICRSNYPDAPPPSAPRPLLKPNEIVVLNTLGELKKLYSLAYCVFVGRSLLEPPMGGSDMIEVTALAKPCCFGPHTHNFAEAVELLTTAKAATVVLDGSDLNHQVNQWLANHAMAREMGQAGRAVIAAQRGSTEKYVVKILGMMETM